MYEDLIKEWAKVEGFETFAEDHAAVLRNLAKWLERRSNGVANNEFDLTNHPEDGPDICTLPTIVIKRDGEEQARLDGAVTKQRLLELIHSARNE